MNIRLLFGEINGKDLIHIGDVVEVTYGPKYKISGRLNKASKKEIKVGLVRINVEIITKIKKKEVKNETK